MSRDTAPVIILIVVTILVLAVVAFLAPISHWIMLALMAVVMALLLATVLWKLEIVD